MAALRSLTWWVGYGLMALAIYAMFESAEWSLGGRLFPWLAGTTILICGTLHAFLGVVRGVRAEADPTGEPETSASLLWRIGVFTWIAGFLLSLPLVGFGVALPLFIFVFMVSEGEKWWLAAVIAFVVWAFVFFVLVGIVNVNLPPSLLEDWLGR